MTGVRDRTRGIAAAGLCGLVACGAVAAPRDALLDVVDDPRAAWRWQVEAGADFTQSLFDAVGVNRQAGHLSAARLTGSSGPWSFELGGHRRLVDDGASQHRVQSWQTALQFEPGEASADTPGRWALRASAWGNRADELVKDTRASLKVSGLKARLSEMELIRPRDRQWQLDGIGRYAPAGSAWAVSGFAGGGRSRVSGAGVTGQATISGCSYRLQFGESRLTAIPMAGCERPLMVSIPNSLLQYDVLRETNYHATWVHTGAALHWRPADWHLVLGVELQRWRHQLPTPVVTHNLIAVGEATWAVTPSLALFVRGQYMHRQLLGEVPMLYNVHSSAASRRHVMTMAGLAARF